jgi:hypothetical protein
MEGWDSPPQQKQINKNNKQTNINGNYKIGFFKINKYLINHFGQLNMLNATTLSSYVFVFYKVVIMVQYIFLKYYIYIIV